MIELVFDTNKLIYGRTAATHSRNEISRDLSRLEGTEAYQAVMRRFAIEAQKARAGESRQSSVASISLAESFH
jgi:hypothetical protein